MANVGARLVLFVAVAMLAAGTSQAQQLPSDADPSWECYAPAPGHPTIAERKAFIESIRPLAVAAELKYQVPAAVVAAMAAEESGYGWTRTALFAKNFFGWKAKEGDASAYHLKCQPTDRDPNAYYVKFSSLELSLANVASRLRESGHYKWETARYQADLAAGVDPKLAAKLWLDAIAPRYTGDPAQYRRNVRRIMNDPHNPSDIINVATTLYELAPKPTSDKKYDSMVKTTAYVKARELIGTKFDPGHRTMDACIEKSGQVITDFKGYEGYSVKRCIYIVDRSTKAQPPSSENRISGLVYTLHPTKEQVAGWVAFACLRAKVADEANCAMKLLADGDAGVIGSNGGQYPVAGNVIEIGSAGNCDRKTVLNNIQFRDGITIKPAKMTVCTVGQRTIEQQELDAKAPVEEYKSVARISAAHRSLYVSVTGKTPSGREWAKLNHLSHLTALDDGVNSILNMRAASIFGNK